MSRPTPIEHADLVPALISCIEIRGRNAADFSRCARDGRTATTVYEALAYVLDQQPEAVRQELHKYRAGLRVPRVRKVVALVDAAAEIGWIDINAVGSGAETLVAWCRAELGRQGARHVELERRAEARRRGTMQRRIQHLVVETFNDAGVGQLDEEAGTAVLSQLVELVVSTTIEELTARQHWWDAGSAKRLREAGKVARQQLHSAATMVAGAWHRQSLEVQEDRSRIADGWHERESSNHFLQRAAALSETQLAQRALKLGIGRGQLSRILRSLEGGMQLSRDDAKRCEELLGGLRLRRFTASS